MDQYIKEFSKDDAETYVRFMIAVCKSDGAEIDERERNYLNLQSQLISLDNIEQYWNEDFNIDSIDYSALSDTVKLAIIRDCIVIANIDNEYHELERKEILNIASKIDVSEPKVIEIEDWLKEYWVHLKKGVRIFETITPIYSSS